MKAVTSLKDAENTYFIVYDNSFDNLSIYQELKRLKTYAAQKSNVILLDFICFEYILLEFEHLIDWVFAPEDELKQKRSKIIDARNKLVEMLKKGESNYKALREIVEYDSHLEEHNIEQLSAKLLFDITRNTGFEVEKGKIGPCWMENCCDWEERQKDDICGLSDLQLSLADKMKAIYYGTSLCKKIPQVGLEVSV